MNKSSTKCRDGETVYTTRITLRNGRVLYASEVGKKVFVFQAKCTCEKCK